MSSLSMLDTPVVRKLWLRIRRSEFPVLVLLLQEWLQVSHLFMQKVFT